MSSIKQQKEKETSQIDEEKISDEIVEQTMKEIFESLAESDEDEKNPAVENDEEDVNEGPVILNFNDKEVSKKGRRKNRNADNKKIKMIIAGVAGAVLAVYLGISLFFINHFYFGTTINDISFSGKTVQNVEEYMQKQVSEYVITLHAKEGKTEQIKGADVDLQYKNGKGLEEALKEQNPFLWFTAFFGTKNAHVVVEVDYNAEKLDQIVTTLEMMKAENQVVPVAAQPVYNGEQFVVQEEVYGTQIHQEQFLKKIHEYVGQFKHDLDLEKEKCYVLPKFTKDSKEVTAATDVMNTYLQSSVTYSVEPAEVVDKSLISQWIVADPDMNVVVSTDAVGAYVNELCKKYNTAGKVRTITTPTGKVAQVSGGGYGWKINYDAEYATLMENIKSGQAVTREPVYAQKAAAHGAADWGSTYLEVDLSTQHMWYIVNGAVAFESDVVTGLPTPKRETPQGVYTILEKINGKYLTGEIQPDGKPEYRTWVDYWMRVTWSGIGFHDAPWQPKFGGELYKSKGSHGCINMPVSAVSQLYGMVEKGCPVVMHY